jgi:hypothetical protein
MRKLNLLLCLVLAVGCATVTRGVEEVYMVETWPAGATVTLAWDEPATLFVEDDGGDTRGTESEGDPGVEKGKKTISFTRLEGMTPATFKIPRKGAFTVTVAKDGYQPVSVHVKTQVAGTGGLAMAGNVGFGLCLGPVGGVVDATSGATLEHVPPFVKVKLEKVDANPTLEPPSGRGDRVK